LGKMYALTTKLLWIREFTKMENKWIDHFSFHKEISCICKVFQETGKHSVFRPLDFFHILLHYSLILKLIQYFFPLINLHTIPQMTKQKQVFRNVCKFIILFKKNITITYSWSRKFTYTGWSH
jgi:hypothetical protein